MKYLLAFSLLATPILLSACAPKVGSDAWCQAMKEKPKGDWSSNDVKAFAEHCVFK